MVLLGLIATAAACRFTDLKTQPLCQSLNVLLDQGLTWAREQQVIIKDLLLTLSTTAKEFIESTHQQLTAKN